MRNSVDDEGPPVPTQPTVADWKWTCCTDMAARGGAVLTVTRGARVGINACQGLRYAAPTAATSSAARPTAVSARLARASTSGAYYVVFRAPDST